MSYECKKCNRKYPSKYYFVDDNTANNCIHCEPLSQKDSVMTPPSGAVTQNNNSNFRKALQILHRILSYVLFIYLICIINFLFYKWANSGQKNIYYFQNNTKYIDLLIISYVMFLSISIVLYLVNNKNSNNLAKIIKSKREEPSLALLSSSILGIMAGTPVSVIIWLIHLNNTKHRPTYWIPGAGVGAAIIIFLTGVSYILCIVGLNCLIMRLLVGKKGELRCMIVLFLNFNIIIPIYLWIMIGFVPALVIFIIATVGTKIVSWSCPQIRF